MNRLVWAVLLAASAAYAQDPSDFRSAAPITPAAGDALQRLTLPFEAYRDTRPDLADIRIFNVGGEAMPMAFAGIANPQEDAPAKTSLPMFALYEPQRRENGSESLDVRVQTSASGTIISLKGAPRPGSRAPLPVAWLLDASQLKTPIRHLVIDWNFRPGIEAILVTVEASDDLKSWRTVATRAPILRVHEGTRELAQPKVDLRNTTARYLRVTTNHPAFLLRGAEAEASPTSRAVARATRSVPGALGAKPGEYVFDLGARIPVETMRLRLAAENSVAPVALLARDVPSAEPRHVTGATFYWLVRNGAEFQSPPVDIGRLTARYWVARLDPGSPLPGGGPPTLEVEWRPAQVIFVARGDAPFSLAFGNPEAKRAVLAPQQLIPGYERLAELKLPEAKVGAVTAERRDDWLRKLIGDASPRKLALWAILIVAVVALGFMAWRLSRQMVRDTPP